MGKVYNDFDTSRRQTLPSKISEMKSSEYFVICVAYFGLSFKV